MAPERDALSRSLQRFGLERDRMRAALARHAGMSGTDLDALEHLEADGPLTQRDLGDRLSLTSGAVTMLVDRLEKAGWVHRRPHPSDRRYVLPRAVASYAGGGTGGPGSLPRHDSPGGQERPGQASRSRSCLLGGGGGRRLPGRDGNTRLTTPETPD